jgi:hypothetical protein
MSSSNNNNTSINPQNAPSQWADIIGEIMEKLSGTNMSTTINFDQLEVDVPHAKGPDGRDIGSAKWVINGKIQWTTEASKKDNR